MITAILSAYCKDIKGNFAITFVIGIFMLLAGVALAINAGQLHSNKSKLNDAADVAILAAVTAVSDEIELIEKGNWKEIGITTGDNVFTQNIAGIKGLGDIKSEIFLDVIGGREIEGRLVYKTEAPTFLSGILGQDKVTISEEVKAVKTLFKFSRINFLVDVSTSMAIGADLENQTKLKNETGCAFACHYRLDSSFTNTIDVARSLGLNLRIDTVKDALTKMVSELNANKGNNKEFQIAIYTFSNSLVEHLPPTTNFNTVLASIEDLEISGENFQGGTNIQHSLRQLADIIPRGYEGKSQKFRKSYVIALTDGVENSVINFNNPGAAFASQAVDPNFSLFAPTQKIGPRDDIQGFNPESCDNIKNNNHTFAFVNPIYLVPDTGSHSGSSAIKLDHIENTLLDLIPRNAEDCATNASLAFSAETTEAVQQATNDLFKELFGENVRLTK